MAYTALYRKYRPQNFDEVVGQTQIVQTLNNAVKRNRIAHAYLFSGPRGTGKTSIAKIFAKTLNCTGDNPPCGECDNCKMAAAGTHPDIIEIDAASNNGVDEVRSLIELVNYAPIHGKYKVYIIDEVHMMTTGAFNALLKTIEEPPAHAVFIFATTEPHKVLPTILSRCQRFDFSRVPDSQIQGRLEFVCKEENVPYTQDGLELIATLADGGMRDSLSILDQCIAYSPEMINADTVRDIYGLATEENIGEIFQALTPEKALDAVHKLDELSENGMDLKRFLSDFIRLLKNSLIMDFNTNTELVTDHQRTVIQKYFSSQNPQKRIQLLDDLMDTYNKLSFASNILDYIETSLLKSAYIPPRNTYYDKAEPGLQHQISPLSADTSPQLSSNSVKENQNQLNSEPHKPLTSTQTYMKSDIQKSVGHNINNHKISEKFWNSDVSRETSFKRETSIPTVVLEDEFLLSLLNAGNKKEKEKDLESFKSLRIYESEISTAKFAKSLQNASLEASSPTFILVSVPSGIEVNQINEFQKTEGFEILTEKMFGTPKAVYAIVRKRVNGLIKLFVTRMKEGSLPPAYKAPLRKAKHLQEEEIDAERVIREFFPEVEVVDD